MKVAFHFKCGHFKIRYDQYFYSQLFSQYLNLGDFELDTDIRAADLLIHNLRDRNTPAELLRELIASTSSTWMRIDPLTLSLLYNESVFVLCFETITQDQAMVLDEIFKSDENYLGGFEVIEDSSMHDYLYKQVLGKRMHIKNRDLLWYVGFDHEEYLDATEDMIGFFRKLPFDSVSFMVLYE
jgi:hypothetical protein